MSLPIPNIPNVPGVPALPGYSNEDVSFLTEDVADGFVGQSGPQWGIFLNGVNVIEADSVVTFDYKQDWTLPNYPIEGGGFESYDKVQLPYDVRVRFATGGDQVSRQAFLNSIAAIAGDFNLYNVVTPEEVYTSVNVTHYDYHRAATNGVGLITVDIWLIQVNVTSTATFSNTQQPNGADPTNNGTTQAQPASAGETSAVQSAATASSGSNGTGPGANGGTSY